MRFRVLGPLDVVSDGALVRVTSGRLRCLLAMLLVRANNVVGFDELVEAVWGDALPVNPRPAVYTLVARLRARIGSAAVIEAAADGYRLVVDEDEIDVKRFDAMVRGARGEAEREVDVLDEALALWRGEALADVPSDYLRRMTYPLAERRLQVLERRFELDLLAGQQEAALPDFQALAVAHPLRERMWSILVLALSRVGRQAEALEAYSAVRRRLVDELGLSRARICGGHIRLSWLGMRVTGGKWSVSCPLMSTASPTGTMNYETCFG